MGSEIIGNSDPMGETDVRFDSLLQNERREARVLKMGEVAMDASELGVEISEAIDCAEEGRGMELPISVFVFDWSLSSRTLIFGFDENWTRRDPLGGQSVC
jgi:hypothetical protein